MKPQIAISEFNYSLDDSKIAKYPLNDRETSKLLQFKDNEIADYSFNDILSLLPKNTLLVFNNTKVIRARLLFKKPTGALIEIFCLEPAFNIDVQNSFALTNNAEWCCIIGNSKKWKDGTVSSHCTIDNKVTEVFAERIGFSDDSQIVRFTWQDSTISFGEIIESLGQIPIPPYLNRKSETIDNERYQTVYSEHKGSVAAPTAGLHFTNDLLDKLKANGVKLANVTLHVGAGTFKPVKSSDIKDHLMHTEHFTIEKSTLETLANHDGPIIAVGTTSVRTLESLYWLSAKSSQQISKSVNQWDAYEIVSNKSYKESLNHLLSLMNHQTTISAHTSIMIAPGYEFKAINALVTNFHQPQSTLLLLISALIGNDWLKVYQHAIDNNYRFLSYGDSSLLYPNTTKKE